MSSSSAAVYYRVILSLEAPNKFGKCIPEFVETHSSLLGCERIPVSATIMSRSCFASLQVFVFKFSRHYLNIIIFIDNSLGPLTIESPCIMKFKLNFLNYAAAPFLRLASNLEDQDGISERSMWELH